VRDDDRRRRRPAAQRLSVSFFHPRRLPRPARHLRHPLARHDDRPNLGQGFPAAHPAADAVLQHLLARPRHHLGRHLHNRLSDRDTAMTEDETNLVDVAPGSPHNNIMSEVVAYVMGLGLALILTGISFWVASTGVLWGPGVATGLVVLAIAQMGVHLVFFLHITSGPDNTNNVLALAF